MGTRSRQSVAFDGVNDTAVVGSSTPYDFDRTDPFSISLWMKKPAGVGYIISKYQIAGPTGWGILVSDVQLRLELQNTSIGPLRIRVDVDLPLDGIWHHVVATWDGDVIGGAAGANLYIDGSPGPNRTELEDLLGANTISNTGALTVGAVSYGATYFSGSVDFVSVYDVELTPGNATTLYNGGDPADPRLALPAGLVAFWPMDVVSFPKIRNVVATGSDANYNPISDFSRLGADMIVGGGFNAGDVSTDNPGGISTHSFAPDAGFERFSVAHGSLDYRVARLAPGRPFSLSYWMKSTSAGGSVWMSKIDSAFTTGFYSGASSSGGGGAGTTYLILQGETAGAGDRVYVRGTTDLHDGSWHHVCVTYDGAVPVVASGVKVWVDGVDESTIVDDAFPSDKTFLNASVPLQISGVGGTTTGNMTINMKAAELQLWGRALSGAEVSAVYNGGAPEHPDSLGDDEMWGHWRPGEELHDLTMTVMTADDVQFPDAPGGLFGCDVPTSPYSCADVDRSAGDGCLTALGGGPGIPYYKMRGQDDGVPAPGYVTWTSLGPDFAGAGSGDAEPPLIGSLIPGKTIVVGRFFANG